MEKILELQFIDVENNEIIKSSEYQSEDEITATVMEIEATAKEGHEVIIVDNKDQFLNCQHQSTEQVVEGNRETYKLYVKVEMEEPVTG